MSEKITISIVDDDASFREAMMSLMTSHGYSALAFESAEAFLSSDRRPTTHCLIVDFQMSGMSGLELHERLAASGAPVPTILITARQDATTRRRALDAGVLCYLTKPFDEAHLLACIRSAVADGPSQPRL